jgi:outer membrane murein-binding lipoprotein Lpp
MQLSASSQPQLAMVCSPMKAFIGIILVTFVVRGAEVTPLEKVTGLLESLSKKIAEEGKEEAASYDKYACFCKEQVDEKTFAIEKSQGKIEYLSADIKELTTKIADLSGDVSELNEKISEIEKDVNKGKEARNKEHKEYLAKAQDMDEAISGAAGAREAIQNAKTSMKGAKLNLVQLKTLQAVLSKHPVVNDASMRLLAMTRQPAFQVQSNDILATIEEIEADFRKMKKDLDNDESEAKFQWNQKQMSLMHESTFSAKDRDEKAQMLESKTEELEEAKLSKDEESKDLAADEAFLKEVTESCETKAKLFDERSSARSAELTAITKALDALKEGDAGKMSELQRGSRSGVLSSSPPRIMSLSRKPLAGEEAFIQIRSVRHHLSERMVAMKRAQLLIAAAAEKSPELSTLAVRMKLAGDHFVKVRNLIKDLLAKLKGDAAAEAETKGLCDKDMKKALGDRDEATGKIEAASAKISTLTAAKKLSRSGQCGLEQADLEADEGSQ